MAQPGEARTAPNARVWTIQKWLIGVTAGYWAAGIILAFGVELQPDKSLLVSDGIVLGIVYLLTGIAWLVYVAGQGLLMHLRPRDVQGRLLSPADRTGLPMLYGLTMIWSGICLVLAWWLFGFYMTRPPHQDYSGVFDAMVGLYSASILPLTALEAYGLWRRLTKHRIRT